MTDDRITDEQIGELIAELNHDADEHKAFVPSDKAYQRMRHNSVQAITHLRERAEKAEAREARLREALERLRPIAYYYDPEAHGVKVNRAPRFNGMCFIIDAALNPKEKNND